LPLISKDSPFDNYKPCPSNFIQLSLPFKIYLRPRYSLDVLDNSAKIFKMKIDEVSDKENSMTIEKLFKMQIYRVF